MAAWTQIENNASFNIIKDGKDVDAKTVNHAIDNVKGNLQYLYEEVSNLKGDKGAVVVYDAPITSTTTPENMKPGTPVYWKSETEDDEGGAWAPAQVALKDPDADEDSKYYWIYDKSSLAQGIVLRQTVQGTVDICLSGKAIFDLKEADGIWYVVDPLGNTSEGNPLKSLFNHHETGGNSTVANSFTHLGCIPTGLRSGTFYLTEVAGKFAPSSKYTRAFAVMIVDKVGGGYKLNVLVCPEGLGGQRFHTHTRLDIVSNGFATGINRAVIPESWFPEVTGGKKYLNTAMAEIETGSEVFPYTELIGANSGQSNAQAAQRLQGNSEIEAGWRSAADSYFTDVDLEIPAGAIWGYTVSKINDLESDSGSEEVWSLPVDPQHIILTMDGQPVPRSYYEINHDGLWWLAPGVEHAPMYSLFSADETSRALALWFVDPLGETEGASITTLQSDELLITKDVSGVAKVETRDTYLSQTLTPVLPFNPMDAVSRASEDEVDAAVAETVMTPLTTHHALEHFVALTDMDADRSCKVWEGDWADLKVSGFYKVIGANDGPLDSEETSPLALVGSHGTQVFQFELGLYGTFVRVRSGALNWGTWMRLTEKPYDPLYLPHSTEPNILETTTLDLARHRERTVVSASESSNLVAVPKLTGHGYEDGLKLRFMNETSQGSIASTLVIRLGNSISGYDGNYLVCPAQQCTPADHHMGLIAYAASDEGDVLNIPNYLDVQITAEFANEGLLTATDVANPDTENTRYVKVDCEAPQYYGNNTVSLEVINGVWAITGGYGIWFILSEEAYTELGTGDSNDVSGYLNKLLGETRLSENKLQNNQLTALKFTSKQVRSRVHNHSIPSWGRQVFTASGHICGLGSGSNALGSNWWLPSAYREYPRPY